MTTINMIFRMLFVVTPLWILLTSALAVHGQSVGLSGVEQWGQWRGPLGTGVSTTADPPITWDEQNHVKWRVELPGLGHSSPVVWGDLIFLTTAIPVGPVLPPRYSQAPGAHDNLPVTQAQEFFVLALRRADGQIVWKNRVHEALPREAGHFTGSLANASAATDGEFVFANFGSYGVYCLDMTGTLVWERQFGEMQSIHGHGEGSSPLLVSDRVILNWDHEGESFIVALDKRTGKDLWRKSRREVTSWSTPIVIPSGAEASEKAQIVVPGTGRIRSYDPDSGEVNWECGGLSQNVVASPVSDGRMVFVGSSYETRNLLAIRLKHAHGDITDSGHVVWSRRDRTPYVPSLLLYGDYLYFLRHYQGILTRVSASSGTSEIGPLRLGELGDIYASPVGAANRVYISDLDGVTQVISHESVPRLLAVNRLDDSFSASAAVVGKELFLRGKRALYCLSE